MPDRNRITPWLATMLRNGAMLMVLVLLFPVGRYIETHADSFYVDVISRIGIAITLAVSLQLINGIAGQFSLGHAGFMAVGAYIAGYAVLTHGKFIDTDEEEFHYANPAAVAGYFTSLFIILSIAGGMVGGLVIAIKRSRVIARSMPLILVFVLLLWIGWDLVSSGNEPHIYHVWSHLFRLTTSFFDWLVARLARPEWMSLFAPGLREPLTMFVALLGGGIIAAIAGFVVGTPTLRLKGDYLAIATLGFAEIIRIVIVNMPSLGAATGLSAPSYPLAPGDESGEPGRFILPWVYGAAIVTIIVVGRLKHSPKGKSIQAVRDDEIAAAATGIDTTHHKVLAFIIGAFFAGVAGALYAFFRGFIGTNDFDFMKSVELVVIVTIGGLGSIPGAVIAAIALTILQVAPRMATLWLPDGTPQWIIERMIWVRDQRMILYAVVLILVTIARARGWLRIPRWTRRPAGETA